MKRRKFLCNSAAVLSALPILRLNPFSDPKSSFPMNIDIANNKIGEIGCTAFRDTMFKYMAKDFFFNANQAELNQSLEKSQINPDNILSPFIPILLQQKDKKILIDTGIGFSEKPIDVQGKDVMFKGMTHQLLDQEKINKEEISEVIITHFHPDHVGGIFSEDGKLQFPNARFHVHEDEWNFWHSSQSDNQPAYFKYFIKKNITPLKGGNLNFIKGDFVEILPGITSVKADGHTPGQIALIIQSGKEHLLYISDAFLHPLHIEKLNWQTSYDLDHEKALRSRIKLIELAYKENMLINAFHFDFPGFGRIDKIESNWFWNYSEK